VTIGFMLNGESVTCEAAMGERLIDLLRDRFHLTGARAGCREGICGACTVFWNDRVVNACLVPAFRARDTEVLTLEAFATTPGYRDIRDGFAEAGVETCGFCDAGTIFGAEALLSRNPQPTREEIAAAFDGTRCGCADPERLVAGTLAAAERRRRRRYGRRA